MQQQKSKILITATLLAALVGLGTVLARTYHSQPEEKTVLGQFEFSPVAEFEPMAGVIFSEFLLSDNTDGELFVRAVLNTGVKIVLVTDDFDPPKKLDAIHKSLNLPEEQRNQISIIGAPHESYWLRDFGPQPFRMRSPHQQNTVFFDYIYREESKLDDTIPYTVGMYLSKTVIHIPLPLDGGNFLTNGSDCLLTDGFDKRYFLDEQGSLATTEKNFHNSHGCKRLLIFDADAHEHIDMWAKFVDHETILVNEIRPELFQLAEKKFIDTSEARRKQRSLNLAAERLAKFYRVIRVPMPFPYGDLFRTYVNMVILNGQAILPSFRRQYPSREPYFDHEFLGRYEQEIAEKMTQLNYKTQFVNSDYLISNGGSFHCVTSHIPE